MPKKISRLPENTPRSKIADEPIVFGRVVAQRTYRIGGATVGIYQRSNGLGSGLDFDRRVGKLIDKALRARLKELKRAKASHINRGQ